MIARRWRGWASERAGADAYESHFSGSVRPALEATDGFVDATVERVEADGRVEIVVVTRWESMYAIRSFAGDAVDAAVVEPEARAALADFDARVQQIELRDGDAFGHLELIDIPAQASAHEPWFNETFVTVNDAVIRPGHHRGRLPLAQARRPGRVLLRRRGRTADRSAGRRAHGHPRPAPGLQRATRRRPPHAGAVADADPDGRGRRRGP